MCSLLQTESKTFTDDQIIVTGEHLAEMYNIRRDKWTSLPNIYRSRSNHASYAINDKAYVFCGLDTTSIERLDLANLKLGWKFIETSLGIGARKNLKAALLNDSEIILLGGRNIRDMAVEDAVIFNYSLETTSKVRFTGQSDQ